MSEEVFQDRNFLLGMVPSLKDSIMAMWVEAGVAATVLFRLSSRLQRRGHPLLSVLVMRLNLALHGCQIHPRSRIEPGLRLPHPVGVVVGWGVRVGGCATLFQNVTLGAKSLEGSDYPTLGEQVVIFPNSVVAGAIRLGDGCRVGAGSVVLHDVPAGLTVAGVPAVALSGYPKPEGIARATGEGA